MSEELDRKPEDPEVALCRALPIADLNGHDARSIAALLKAGGWAFYNGQDRWTYGVYMFMLRQKYDMQFRFGWHWNNCAGDPYYALDCREDDYSWANSNARRELVTSLQFERLREGVDDYRYLLTLRRLANGQPANPAAAGVKALLDKVLALTPGADRDMHGPFGYPEVRAEAVSLLRQFAR